jgi:hypothetical protein
VGTPDHHADNVPGPLRQALLGCAADRLSGVLRVAGRPGGTVHFSDGGIIAAETPGAPGLEVILFRSGRVDELGWDAAFAAAAATGREMRNELIGRELVGAGELEALSRLAIADAVFAMAYGTVEDYRTETSASAAPMVTLEPGDEAGWLLAETSRRIRSLSPFAGRAHARIAMAPGAVRPGLPVSGGRDKLAALADGRRTPRDLAFALGRGVYATLLELGRMQADGLMIVADPGPARPAEAAAAGLPPAAADSAEAIESLPRRRRDHASAAVRAGTRDLPAAFRLLRLRYGEGTASGGAK